jgi:hypothetical protein
MIYVLRVVVRHECILLTTTESVIPIRTCAGTAPITGAVHDLRTLAAEARILAELDCAARRRAYVEPPNLERLDRIALDPPTCSASTSIRESLLWTARCPTD